MLGYQAWDSTRSLPGVERATAARFTNGGKARDRRSPFRRTFRVSSHIEA